jgi:hypothetical protein
MSLDILPFLEFQGTQRESVEFHLRLHECIAGKCFANNSLAKNLIKVPINSTQYNLFDISPFRSICFQVIIF